MIFFRCWENVQIPTKNDRQHVHIQNHIPSKAKAIAIYKPFSNPTILDLDLD